MSHLVQLRQRILSIKKTCKITHAMRLMSMSLYAKIEKQSVAISRYRKRITTLVKELSAYYPTWKNNTFFPEDILDGNPLIIIIASSRGLCGSFNASLLRYFDDDYALESHQKPTFITVGEKAKLFLQKKKNAPLKAHYEEFTSSTFITIAQELTNTICKATPAYSSVTLYANSLKNFFVQIPTKKTIIPLPMDFSPSSKPLSEKEAAQGELTFKEEPLWEQNKEDIFSSMGTSFLRGLILDTLLESIMAEQAARFVAMDNSTTNAEKYLEKLTLQYNKSRQAIITAEVAELASGFMQVRR